MGDTCAHWCKRRKQLLHYLEIDRHEKLENVEQPPLNFVLPCEWRLLPDNTTYIIRLPTKY